MIILIIKINKKVTKTNMNYCLCCFAFIIWCICIWNVTSSLHTGANYLLVHSLLKSCKCTINISIQVTGTTKRNCYLYCFLCTFCWWPYGTYPSIY